MHEKTIPDRTQDPERRPATFLEPRRHQLEGRWVDASQKEAGREAQRDPGGRAACDHQQPVDGRSPDRSPKDHVPRRDDIANRRVVYMSRSDEKAIQSLLALPSMKRCQSFGTAS
jgi:hypothetical protein